MSRFVATALTLLLLFLASQALAQNAKPKRRANPALAQIENDPNLPRVLLIGDSISIGYTLPTRELLKGKVNVHRIATNGGPTTKGLGQIDQWFGDSKWDVIHFNWGLHDLKHIDGKQQVPLEQYQQNLAKLVARLKQTGATLIWASTTPVPDAKVNPHRTDADVQAYNAAAAKIMKQHGVATDDLYSHTKPQLEKIQRPANVHFTPEGSKVLAQQVADSIQQALGKKDS